MVIRLPQLLDAIEKESARTLRAIDDARDQADQVPQRLETLAEKRTDAFIELARHYLPQLSHQALADAWIEVRDQIHDVLLRKDDQCRRLRLLRDEMEAGLRNTLCERAEVAAELEKARLDLSSKRGNARKMLSEDQQVAACVQAIDDVDDEIDKALSLLDSAEADARKKLPEFEACSLFRYLQEQRFGTPEYAAGGIERRWDRWVAKFVNYKQAKASYDYLRATPHQLVSLINKKRQQYQELLSQLEQAHDRAHSHFSVDDQSRLWKKLGERIECIDQNAENAEREISVIAEQLHEVQRTHYEHAIDIYRQFLIDLDPEILRVYAACTKSPVDDQICARVRKIQQDIESQSPQRGQPDSPTVPLQKYLSGLSELSWRLKRVARESSREIQWRGGFSLGRCLSELRQRARSPSDVWLAILAAIVDPSVSRLGTARLEFSKIEKLRTDGSGDGPVDSGAASDEHLLETLFMAASGQPSTPFSKRPLDPLDVVLLSPEQSRRMGSDRLGGFIAAAVCHCNSDARQLTRWLEQQGVVGFMHDHQIGASLAATRLHSMDDVVVMVRPIQYDRARQLIADLRSDHSGAWSCPTCVVAVDTGYSFCWRCGDHRGTGSLPRGIDE
jgi:tetratricopeptide (TPR) repeat protein